ncbi:MAG: hypothetical protein SFV32_03145 [Opitutaceae bacterium]|nr:hypothetical protein [Opitutaceae bacterium]
MNTLRSALLLATTLAIGTSLKADPVSVYDYMDGLGGTYPVQVGSETWTFHNGDENGSLMPQYGGDGYGNYGYYAQFTSPGPAGSSSGAAGASDLPGIFVHTASSGYITAVLHLANLVSLNGVYIDSELVGNGLWGNGIDFTLRTVIGGVATDHGSGSMLSSTTSRTAISFGPAGLTFGSGDKIAVLFSNRGSYLHDHGWWDIGFNVKDQGTPTPPPSNRVPDAASTLGLSALALGLVAAARRRLA